MLLTNPLAPETTAPILPTSRLRQALLVAAGLTALAMLAIGVGPSAVPMWIRHGVGAACLAAIAIDYLRAGRRTDLPAPYAGTFTFIGIGFGLCGAALLMQALTQSATPLPVPALINLLGYMVAIVGILRLPSRTLGPTDRWFVISDSCTILAGLGVMLLVLEREGAFQPSRLPSLLPIVGILFAILGCLSAVALRAEPIPNVRTLRWNVHSLCVLFAAVLIGLLFASGLLQDRRLHDVFFYIYLALQLIVSDHYRRDALEQAHAKPTSSIRWLVRAGPAAVTLVITQTAILLWCLTRGAERSALLMGVGIVASSLPVLARLQAWRLRRLGRLDRQLAEREARLEAMSRLAGGFAHELNNTLTTLMNAAELVRNAPDEASRLADLDELSAAANRAALLARQTLVASGRAMPRRSVEPLAPLVANAGEAARAELGPRWPIQLTEAPGVLLADTDPEHLHALVRLLARIIRGSQPHGGHVEIALEVAHLPAPLDTAAVQVPAGRVARITVVDAPGRIVGEALPDAAVLFERDVTGDPALAFDLTVARGLALALGVGLQVHAARGIGARARLFIPLVAA